MTRGWTLLSLIFLGLGIRVVLGDRVGKIGSSADDENDLSLSGQQELSRKKQCIFMYLHGFTLFDSNRLNLETSGLPVQKKGDRKLLLHLWGISVSLYLLNLTLFGSPYMLFVVLLLIPRLFPSEIRMDLGQGKKGGKAMTEKRNHPRVEVSHPIHYHKDTGPRSGVASTVDLGVGGVGIETSHSLALGDVLQISLPIHSRVIECKGIVVHLVKQMGERLKAGIRFVGLLKRDRLYLVRFISDILAMEKDVLSSRGILIGLGLGFLLWAGIIYMILLLL